MISPALRSALIWLNCLLDGVRPREWPWGGLQSPCLHLFGDASEPDVSSGRRPRIAGVLRLPDSSLRAFAVDIPDDICKCFPGREKNIYYYELLWPAAA
eukprot:2016106-Karenia_brevis.AAC.1